MKNPKSILAVSAALFISLASLRAEITAPQPDAIVEAIVKHDGTLKVTAVDIQQPGISALRVRQALRGVKAEGYSEGERVKFAVVAHEPVSLSVPKVNFMTGRGHPSPYEPKSRR